MDYILSVLLSLSCFLFFVFCFFVFCFLFSPTPQERVERMFDVIFKKQNKKITIVVNPVNVMKLVYAITVKISVVSQLSAYQHIIGRSGVVLNNILHPRDKLFVFGIVQSVSFWVAETKMRQIECAKNKNSSTKESKVPFQWSPTALRCQILAFLKVLPLIQKSSPHTASRNIFSTQFDLMGHVSGSIK